MDDNSDDPGPAAVKEGLVFHMFSPSDVSTEWDKDADVVHLRARPTDDCEVCTGRSGQDAMVTVTFSSDLGHGAVPIRMCTQCVGAVTVTLGQRYNDAVDQDAIDVERLCRLLGVDYPS